ncbi:MAG: putative DNA binding domain-containing protein, partial [Lachnospiraceae bacterium]|nr:putative DNA binding domain-containing protein [Lachnospiraceae bacterium]
MEEKVFLLGEETEQIEFKKSTGELKEAVISMAAILNKHQSGKLYFGVKNNGTVVGQEINDTTLHTISQAIGNHLRPTVYPDIKKQRYGDRTVVLVEFSGTRQPYLAYNIPRIRVADEDLVMEQPVYEEMLRKRDSVSYSWESQKSKYGIADIDQNVFRSYLKKARKVGRISFDNEEPAEVMTKLGLSDDGQLLNAGAALFVDCGINELQMAKFASDERLTFTDIRRFTGSILDLADKAVQYIIDAMDWRVEFDGSLERKEIPEVPVDAAREAVINAFAHRLIESGQSVEVAIYRSFMEIYSPGRFPDGVTPEMFIREIRKPIRRNPLITRTLYYSKDMESFATGLKRIQDACDEAGCKVEYYGDEYGFTVRFYRHCGEGWGADVGAKVTNPKEPNVTLDVTLGVTLDNSTEISVFKLIKENAAITIPQMAERLSVNRRTVQRTISSLKENGFIERK